MAMLPTMPTTPTCVRHVSAKQDADGNVFVGAEPLDFIVIAAMETKSPLDRRRRDDGPASSAFRRYCLARVSRTESFAHQRDHQLAIGRRLTPSSCDVSETTPPSVSPSLYCCSPTFLTLPYLDKLQKQEYR